jgi:PiT family inorganic phosphate transporter
MSVLTYMLRDATPRVNLTFKRTQIANVVALALSHGTNDGQKSMGLIALGLIATQAQHDFAIPIWVTLVVASSMTLGVVTGGWRIIRTMGAHIYRLRPIHATAAQTASAAVVLTAAALGAPVSTTQVTSSAIMGVGSAERMSGVRWQVAGQIVGAWFITIPASAILAGLVQKSLTLQNAWVTK